MIRGHHAVILLLSALAAAGCTTTHDRLSEESSAQDVRDHLAEQGEFQRLREHLRGVAREVSLDIPAACDASVAAVADVDTKCELLTIAAGAGIYACMRAGAPDPRSGLADMVVTFATLEALYTDWAKDPDYKGVQPMVDALKPIVAELWEISGKWLPPDSLETVHTEVADAVKQQEARVRSSRIRGARGGIRPTAPIGLQIRSSFMTFNDNGLLEYGLGEAHYIRLSAQAMADVLALMPGSMEYRARRTMLWAMQQSDVKDMRTSLNDLQELRALRPLARAVDSPWLVGGGVLLFLLLGMSLQGYIIGRAMRTRG